MADTTVAPPSLALPVKKKDKNGKGIERKQATPDGKSLWIPKQSWCRNKHWHILASGLKLSKHTATTTKQTNRATTVAWPPPALKRKEKREQGGKGEREKPRAEKARKGEPLEPKTAAKPKKVRGNCVLFYYRIP